jgi:hypothetical protein
MEKTGSQRFILSSSSSKKGCDEEGLFSARICDAKDFGILLLPEPADGPCNPMVSNAFCCGMDRAWGTVGTAGPSITRSSQMLSMLLHRLNVEKQRSVFGPY